MNKKLLITLIVGAAVVRSASAQESMALPIPAMQPPSPDTSYQPGLTTIPPSMPAPTPVEQRLSDIERRLSLQEQAQPAYPGGPPYLGGEARTGSWMFGMELGPSNLHLAGPVFGRFDRSGGTAAIDFGYEWATGYGIRAELWGFGQNADDFRDDVEVGAGTFDIDLYKKIFVDFTELTVGAGSRAATLDFRSTLDNTHSKFNGGGIDVFAQWYHPIAAGTCWEIAFIGDGRMSLVEGEWRDHTGLFVDDTNDDMLTIFEGGFGLEFRRRFGRLRDKYWYISIEPEIQQWQSQWMTANVATSAGFTSTNFNIGVAW